MDDTENGRWLTYSQLAARLCRFFWSGMPQCCSRVAREWSISCNHGVTLIFLLTACGTLEYFYRIVNK